MKLDKRKDHGAVDKHLLEQQFHFIVSVKNWTGTTGSYGRQVDKN